MSQKFEIPEAAAAETRAYGRREARMPSASTRRPAAARTSSIVRIPCDPRRDRVGFPGRGIADLGVRLNTCVE